MMSLATNGWLQPGQSLATNGVLTLDAVAAVVVDTGRETWIGVATLSPTAALAGVFAYYGQADASLCTLVTTPSRAAHAAAAGASVAIGWQYGGAADSRGASQVAVSGGSLAVVSDHANEVDD